MRIEILGCRGHIDVSAPGYANHSGVLVDDALLFDLGEPFFLDRHPRSIFLTHLHPDHAAFMEGPMEHIDAPVWGPQLTDRLPGLQVARGTIDWDRYQITAIPTNHSATVRSQAYMIEADLQRILYTGDLISIHSRLRDRIPDLDLVITDGSFIRRGGLVRYDEASHRAHGHNGIPDLVEYFSAFTDRILITHFGSWFYKDIEASRKAIESLSGKAKVEAACDGAVVEI
jgi:ribonuclease BN (tRNA processing enzyme)